VYVVVLAVIVTASGTFLIFRRLRRRTQVYVPYEIQSFDDNARRDRLKGHEKIRNGGYIRSEGRYSSLYI
jgi:hypothetical protein